MDLWQFTPLHEATSKNRVEVCSLLLSQGADPTLVNCHSKSALDVAPTRELADRIQCKQRSKCVERVCHTNRRFLWRICLGWQVTEGSRYYYRRNSLLIEMLLPVFVVFLWISGTEFYFEFDVDFSFNALMLWFGNRKNIWSVDQTLLTVVTCFDCVSWCVSGIQRSSSSGQCKTG